MHMAKRNQGTIIEAVGYARRSTDMQERSVPDQKAYVEKWAKENGYRVKRWYVDDAISGTSARGRDAFEQMIVEAEAGSDFRTVLCYDISRFSRGGTNETGYYLHRLKLVGVDVIFPAEGIPDGDEGELLQGVKSWQARQYSVKLARDSIRGKLSNMTQRKSRLGSQAPFGYDRQFVTADGKVLRVLREMPDGSRQEIAPDGTLLRVLPKGERLPKAKSDMVRLIPSLPERVRTVKQMFEWCAGGSGIRTIAMRLNAAGVRTPMGRLWEHTSVASILRNPVYKGSLVWNRMTKAKINGLLPDGTLRPPPRNPNGERNGKDQWLVMDGIHEALISADLWQRTQDAIDRRSKMGGLARPVNRYLLSGLVKCTSCGFNHVGRMGGTGGAIRYYYDGGYMRYGRQVCSPTSINAADLDRFVIEQVRNVIGGDRPAVERAVDRFIKQMKAHAKPDDRRSQIEADLKTVQKRIESVVALLTDGDLDGLAELKATLITLRKRRAAMEAEMATVGGDAPAPTNVGDLRTWALRRLAEIDSMLTNGTGGEPLRQLVAAYVARIEIDPRERRGKLVLAADAMAVLEHDIASISRVKPVDTGFTALKNAYFNNTAIALAILDGENGEGLDADFSVTNFSRSEPLEEAVTVSVTVKPTYSTRAPAWIEGGTP
jgi:DNA invertase Pin-like site-specific DNA recombinase